MKKLIKNNTIINSKYFISLYSLKRVEYDLDKIINIQ